MFVISSLSVCLLKVVQAEETSDSEEATTGVLIDTAGKEEGFTEIESQIHPATEEDLEKRVHDGSIVQEKDKQSSEEQIGIGKGTKALKPKEELVSVV